MIILGIALLIIGSLTEIAIVWACGRRSLAGDG